MAFLHAFVIRVGLETTVITIPMNAIVILVKMVDHAVMASTVTVALV